LGVIQVDARHIAFSFGNGHRRRSRSQQCLSVVIVLLADQFSVHQPSQPLLAEAGNITIRPGARRRRFGSGQFRAIAPRIHLIERLASLHLISLHKQPALDDAGRLGPYLGDAMGEGPPRQLRLQHDITGANGCRHHLDRPGRRRGRCLPLAITPRKEQQQGKQWQYGGRQTMVLKPHGALLDQPDSSTPGRGDGVSRKLDRVLVTTVIGARVYTHQGYIHRRDQVRRPASPPARLKPERWRWRNFAWRTSIATAVCRDGKCRGYERAERQPDPKARTRREEGIRMALPGDRKRVV